jgi:hypothetical protein
LTGAYRPADTRLGAHDPRDERAHRGGAGASAQQPGVSARHASKSCRHRSRRSIPAARMVASHASADVFASRPKARGSPGAGWWRPSSLRYVRGGPLFAFRPWRVLSQWDLTLRRGNDHLGRVARNCHRSSCCAHPWRLPWRKELPSNSACHTDDHRD